MEIATEPFDLVFISGVLMYNDDEEALQALRFIYKLLRPMGLVYIRDYGIENDGWGNPPFGSVMRKLLVHRPPEGIREMAHQTGFNYLRWCRPYPYNIPQALYSQWPNAATKLILQIGQSKLLFPAWGIFAALNLRHRRIKTNYFSYFLQKD